MKKKKETPRGITVLRKLAEEKLSKQIYNIDEMKPLEVKKLLYELQVHQIELEMQNESLLTSQMELDESISKYMDLYNFAPVGYITLSGKGIIEEANSTTARLFGLEKVRILNQPISKFIFSEDQDIYYFNRKNLYNTMKEQQYEIRMKREDGTVFWANIISIISKKKPDTIVNLLNIIDISDRKHFEEELRAQSNTLTAIFESSPYIMVLIDQKGKVKNINGEGIKFSSREKASLLDNLYGEVLKCLHSFKQPGCSLNDECADCPIRNCVNETFTTGETIHNGEGKMVFVSEGKNIELDLLVSTNLLKRNDGNLVLITIVDITERKIYERKLEESEEKFRNAFQYSAIGMALVSPEGKMLKVNSKVSEIIGYSEEELLAKTFQEFTHPDDLESDLNYVRQLLAGEIISYTMEKRYIHKQGNIVWANLAVSLIKDNFYSPLYFISQIEDITERKLAEEELKKKNKFIQKVLDNLPMGVALNEIDTGSSFYANKKFEEIYGWSKEEIVDISGFFQKVYPDEKYRKELMSKILMDIQSGDPSRMHWEDCLVTHKDGSIHVVNAVNIPLFEQNTMVSTVLDITESKQAEQKLRESEQNYKTLADSGQALVWLAGIDKLCYYFNRVWLDFTGRTLEQEIGNGWVEGVHPDDLQNCLNIYTQAFDRRENFSMEYRLRRFDGEYSWILDDGCPRYNSQGEFVGYIGHCLDINKHKQIEQELLTHRNDLEELVRARTEELDKVNAFLRIDIEKEKEIEMMLKNSLAKEKELNEIKTRLISTTSHEFRTPLTSVLSSTELLLRYRKKWSDDKINVHFNRIKGSVQYLVSLLDDVLTLSRAERGIIMFNPRKVNLKILAKEYIEVARALIKNHKLNFNYKSKTTIFSLDPKLIKFIISNLLSNAIKYSPMGGNIDLNISTEQKNLVLEVIDEGIGIPSDEIDHVFQSFYRTKNAEEIAGTGLGLAIVKLAVDLHGGSISVQSKINKGSTFIIKIPKS